jgi:two-component system cell cycle sensor histidine kinase/response regulator CckA
VYSSDVLLVDDNSAVRQVLGDILVLLGYTVIRAESGEEGWALFQEKGARAVITDNLMDDLTGLELAARVKQLSPETPVLLISSDVPGPGNPCDMVLNKPIAYQDLERSLRALGILPGPAPTALRPRDKAPCPG